MKYCQKVHLQNSLDLISLTGQVKSQDELLHDMTILILVVVSLYQLCLNHAWNSVIYYITVTVA